MPEEGLSAKDSQLLCLRRWLKGLEGLYARWNTCKPPLSYHCLDLRTPVNHVRAVKEYVGRTQKELTYIAWWRGFFRRRY